jgi:predicted N-formylglutamate amidohydrolase
MRKLNIIVSCEHATRFIPGEFRDLFCGQEKVLRSHRGWDEGAKELAQSLAKKFKAPLLLGKHSRLLADLNRTPDNRGIFSEWTDSLSRAEKEKIIAWHHFPHWESARRAVKACTKSGNRVLHIGVHSFVPVLNGHRRSTDIGLLYDPRRKREEELCFALQKNLRKHTDFAIHRNLPYRGTGNGLVSAFRKEFSAESYLGLELEINQRCFKAKDATKNISLFFTNAIRAAQK